ncbi:MAG: amidohydrolase [Chitinivibrionales bacterium]|nr:amidohydrolase [Chitinivibrionales bacterium]
MTIPSSSQTCMKKILQRHIEEIYPSIVDIRRHIHSRPELSGEEFETAALVHGKLASLGYSPKFHLHKTGVSASLRHGKGKTLALRADMDALPLDEKNDISFKSQKAGVMHACGHDMHTAALLGAAQVLFRMREHVHGEVRFLFQPSEEVEPGGALGMIKEKAFPSRVDAVFGLHVNSEHVTGQVGLKPGDDCTGVLTFDVIVKGKGGHGAMPETTIDPIVCASSMIMELQTLISRECPPFEPAVLTIGSFHAGTKRNIIPDEARFYGTVRTFSGALQKQLRKRIVDVLEAAARSFRAIVEVSFIDSYPAGYNDPQQTEFARRALQQYLGDANVKQRPFPTMFAEDFAYYLKKAPGCYLHLGVRPPKVKNMPGIHSASFLPQEEALKTAMMTHCALALEFLKQEELSCPEY